MTTKWEKRTKASKKVDDALRHAAMLRERQYARTSNAIRGHWCVWSKPDQLYINRDLRLSPRPTYFTKEMARLVGFYFVKVNHYRPKEVELQRH